MKVLAGLLGPAGIGLIGVYQNIIGIASTIAGCGIGSSGVRQIAAASDQPANLAVVRHALWTANLFLGLSGMAVLWLLREPVAKWVFGNTEHATEIGWLSIGVLLTLVAGSQTTLLQGLRRIGDLARFNILGAFLSVFVSMLPVYWLREQGALWFVLTSIFLSAIVATYYVVRLPRFRLMPFDWPALGREWQGMLKFGLPLMIGTLFTLATQLAVRSIIVREIGLAASGHFQAAWYISMTYIGFVLGAMATDYYPRLTAAMNDHSQAIKIVNEQAEMSLLLSGPILLSMITFAPWVIHLLYAEDFTPAISILRWQVLGDILKVSSWPMSFILLAQGRSGIFIGTELLWNAVYIGMIIFGIQEKGIIITGVSFWISYIFYYISLILIVLKIINYLPTYRNFLFTFFLLVTGGVVIFLATQSVFISYFFGLILTIIVSVYNITRLRLLMNQEKYKR